VTEDRDLENVHQRYVNAERGDEGIPDYFKTRLDRNTQNDLLQEAVFRELWYSDDVIHSIGSLKSRFEEGRETVRSRLDEMVEQGVLKKDSINNGDYWWIDFPESEHPLAKDVVVLPRPETEEMTLREFFNQSHVTIGAIALLATAFGGVAVLLGAFQLAGELTFPIPAAESFRIGLLTLITSYLFLLFAVVVWIVRRTFVSEGETITSEFINR